MNSYENVLSLLDRVAATSGDAKKPLIKLMLTDPFSVTVLKMALDPMRTFGVRNFEVVRCDPGQDGPSLDQFEQIMGHMETRGLSGNAAKRKLEAFSNQGVPRELLMRVIRKDLRAGFGADTMNKVAKGFIKTFKVALAEEYDSEAIQFPLFASPKFDGLRCIVLVNGENVQFLSRNGLPFQALQCHEQAWLDLKNGDMMYDCEVLDGSFFTSLGVKKKKGKSENAVFQVFDMLSVEEFASRVTTSPQRARLSDLQNLLHGRPLTDPIQYTPHALCGNNEVVMDLYDQYRAMGLEGVIAKKPDATYQFKRSNAWTKIKDEKSFDLPVLRVEEGKGRLVGTMGRITVLINGREDGVGTGFDDKARAWFWQEKDNIEKAYVEGHPMIVEVSCHELTPDGSMRHSRFKSVRKDKTIEDGQGV